MKKRIKKKIRSARLPDYAVYRFSKKEWIQYGGTGCIIGIFTQWLCFGTYAAFPVAVLICLLYIKECKGVRRHLRKEALNYHFKELIGSLYASLCAGYSVENSMETAETELSALYGEKDVLVREIREIRRKLTVSEPLWQAFYELGIRSQVTDIRMFGEVLYIANRSGGNLVRILENSRNTIYERIEMAHELSMILSARRLELYVMACIPAGILLYLRAAFGGFLDPLYHTGGGQLFMAAGLMIYLSALKFGKCLIERVR